MRKMEFMNKLNYLLCSLDFDNEAKIDALKYISNYYSFISKASNEVYIDDKDDYSLIKRRPHTRLMILIYKMVALNNTYCEKGLPEEVLFDTLSDVTLRQRMYLKQYGKLGLSDEDIMWLKHIYKLNIFKLGSLQFEIASMKCLTRKGLMYSDEILKKLPQGLPILNVHIRRGVDLSKDAVDESFKTAEIFFAKHFSEYKFLAYVCESWLLYPGNKALLSPPSHILDFARRFELISESNINHMAIKYIFGKRYREKKYYPQETSLQKNALKNLHSLGVGCGVIWKKNI